MRSLWWALIQYDWCLDKKRLGHREIERGKSGEHPAKDSHLQAREERRQRKLKPHLLDLGILAPELRENTFLLFEPPILGRFVMRQA